MEEDQVDEVTGLVGAHCSVVADQSELQCVLEWFLIDSLVNAK